MHLKNTSHKTTISDDCIMVRGVLGKAIGLMFKRQPPKKPLVFVFGSERRINLHMLFVFFPIDVIFLDQKKQVVETVERLRPFSFYISRKKAKYVIEAKAGTIRKTKTTTGDIFSF